MDLNLRELPKAGRSLIASFNRMCRSCDERHKGLESRVAMPSIPCKQRAQSSLGLAALSKKFSFEVWF